MKVNPLTQTCEAFSPEPYHLRNTKTIEYIVIHRISCGNTGIEVAEFFRDHPEVGTRRKMGYHFIIRKDGQIDHCVALNKIAAGAIGMNSNGVQIGVIGDFRKKAPEKEQWKALLLLTTALADFIGKVTITGHTETPGHSKDAAKICPGKGLDLALLRTTVKDILAKRQALALSTLGITVC